MIWQVISNEPMDETDYIVSKDDEAASEASWDRRFYGGFMVISTQHHVKTLESLDFIASPQGVFYCSQPFLNVLSAAGIEMPTRPGQFCLADGTTTLEKQFWQIVPPRAMAEFEEVDPVRYWPKFKKFKFWTGVLHEANADATWLGSFEESPGLFCSEDLKLRFEAASLNMSLSETPTLERA